MADQLLAEVRIFGCNFAPTGWAFCNGQILSISQNTALFSLLGTQYGGNGQTTFALPNLQARAAIHWGQGPGLSDYSIGQQGGTGTVTLITTEIPAHVHNMVGNNGDGSLSTPVNNVPAGPGADRDLFWYNNAATGTLSNMAPAALGITGGSQPHNNLMPYLALNYCIAMQGIFPSRN